MAQVEGSIHRTIAKRIRALRDDQKLSAARLAERMTAAGVRWDRSIVANFENGRRSYITVEELLTVAQVLGVPPMALLAESGSDPIAEVAAVAAQMLRGPYHLEIEADEHGVTDVMFHGIRRRRRRNGEAGQ